MCVCISKDPCQATAVGHGRYTYSECSATVQVDPQETSTKRQEIITTTQTSYYVVMFIDKLPYIKIANTQQQDLYAKNLQTNRKISIPSACSTAKTRDGNTWYWGQRSVRQADLKETSTKPPGSQSCPSTSRRYAFITALGSVATL